MPAFLTTISKLLWSFTERDYCILILYFRKIKMKHVDPSCQNCKLINVHDDQTD